MFDTPRRRLDDLVSLVTDKVLTTKDPTLPYVGLEHLPSGGSQVLGVASSVDFISTNTVFRRGDTLFGKLRPRLRKTVPVAFDGYCSTDILVLRAKPSVHPVFASFILRSDTVFAQAIRTEEGTKMPRCSWIAVKTAEVFCPEHPEQAAVADVLTAVDEAIEHTAALIAKVEQVKAGMMHDLFTRGVTPDGSLRPTRTDAPGMYKETVLGWIPTDWTVHTAQDLCDDVIDCKNRTPRVTDEGYPVIRTPNVRSGRFVWTDLMFTDEVSYKEWTRRGRPTPGDILITREAPVGEVCMLPVELGPACLGQRMMLYRPSGDRVDSGYFLYALQSEAVRRRLDVISGGSTVGHVRVGDVRTLLLPYAPRDEQKIISERLVALQSSLDVLIERCSKLKEQKQGLMADMLSGHVRVRV